MSDYLIELEEETSRVQARGFVPLPLPKLAVIDFIQGMMSPDGNLQRGVHPPSRSGEDHPYPHPPQKLPIKCFEQILKYAF